MKRIIPALTLFICFSVTAFAGNSGFAHTSPFHTVHVAGNVHVILEQGEHEEVDFLTDMHGTNVKFVDGILKIKRLKLKKLDHTVKVRVTYKTLRAIKASSGAILRSEGLIMAEHFDIDASTGAEISAELSLTTLQVTASEGAVISLYGQTDSQNVRAVTGAEVDAYDLECNYTFAKAGTGGSVEVVANKRIESRTSLGGDINYRGNPRETHFDHDDEENQH